MHPGLIFVALCLVFTMCLECSKNLGEKIALSSPKELSDVGTVFTLILQVRKLSPEEVA